MPAKRRYNIKGTNDFLVLGGIFFFLCLWAIKDAWFPSAKVLKKHPLSIEVAFEVAGAVEKVHVAVGDPVAEKQLLANLRRDRLGVEYEEAKSAYTAANKKHAMMQLAHNNANKNGASDDGISNIKESLDAAKAAMDEALAQVTELRKALDSSELLSPSKGEVKEIKVHAHSMVEAGETAMILNPKDHFYLFNKSLAIFSFFAFWIFLAIHILAR
jgi:multidrug resistance efflux pump